jgi:hypothetical protein
MLKDNILKLKMLWFYIFAWNNNCFWNIKRIRVKALKNELIRLQLIRYEINKNIK